MVLTRLQPVLGGRPLDFARADHLNAWTKVKLGYALDPASTDPRRELLRFIPGSPTVVGTENYLFDKNPLTYRIQLLPVNVSFRQSSLLEGVRVYLGFADSNAHVYMYGSPLSNWVESWHAAKISLGGLHAALGFPNEDGAKAFRKEVVRDALFSDIGDDALYNPLPQFVSVNGTFFDGERMRHLILLPPKVLQTVLHLFGVQEDALPPPPQPTPAKKVEWLRATKADLEFIADHQARTLGGTVYYFRGIAGKSRVVGIRRRDGGYFRLVSDSPVEDSASHAAILSRQIDPFGLGRVRIKTLDDQMNTAARVMAMLFRKIKFEDSFEYAPPLPPSEELAVAGKERMEAIQEKLARLKKHSHVEATLLRMRHGVEPWREAASNMDHRFLRFVWISGAEDDTGFFAVDENLLHTQMLLSVIQPKILERHLWNGYNHWPQKDRYANLLRYGVRGGSMVLSYKGTRLARADIVDGRMSLPLWHAEALGPLEMTGEERGVLEGQLIESLRKPNT